MQTALNGSLVIGSGPAGLTASYELANHGHTGIILEAGEAVGGLSRTIEWEGYHFDIGAHRFFTKVAEIDRLWEEILGEPLATCKRLTRILYAGKFYDYPLKATNALKNMGLMAAISCLLSYLKAKARPIPTPKNFEEWVINQFGERLYRMFFKSYTEKVWGCPCTQIGADWAAQRIKGLNLGEAIKTAFGWKAGDRTITTLIDTFKYPPLGPGQLWARCASNIRKRGWQIHLQTPVTGMELKDRRISTVIARDFQHREVQFAPLQVLSSMPLRELLQCLKPSVPRDIAEAASSLAYRDFMLVVLVLDVPEIFPDNWIYVHNPNVRVGRIDNFGNWTPGMLPNRATSCLAMEYFVFEGDNLWDSDDDSMIKLAYQELCNIGLAKGNLVKGKVVRIPKAYPVYDTGYRERLDMIRRWLKENIVNLQCMGRNGQHRYNNQDHSMATGLIAARNILFCENRDAWAVNEDAEYHEISKTEREAPLLPRTRIIATNSSTARTELITQH